MSTENDQKSALDDVDEEVIVALSDYIEGTASPEEKKRVEDKIASDPTWKAAHDEMMAGKEATSTLSGLRNARAPVNLTEDVTGTIHKRSAGRFFGKKTFGDRVPFTAILVVAILGLVAIGYIMYSSQTGSLKVDQKKEAPPPPPGPLITPP